MLVFRSSVVVFLFFFLIALLIIFDEYPSDNNALQMTSVYLVICSVSATSGDKCFTMYLTVLDRGVISDWYV